MISDIYFRFLLETISNDASIIEKPSTHQELGIEQNKVPIKYFSYLIEFNYTQNINSKLGLTFGKNVVALNLCDFFRMINSAETIEECLNDTVNSYHILGLRPYPMMQKGPKTTSLSISYPYDDKPCEFVSRFTCEVFFTYGLDLLQKSISKDIKPTRIFFDFPKPNYSEKYDELFGCEITYDAPLSLIEFDSILLNATLPSHNKPLHNIYMTKAFEKWRDTKRSQSFRYRATTHLMSQSPYNFSSSNLASNMNISTRGLQKRLASEDCSYSQLCKSARRELTKICLFQKGMDLEETANILGFQTQISFRKFFKEVFGHTPKVYLSSISKEELLESA
jgi:AraC-like DNA-binding protein